MKSHDGGAIEDRPRSGLDHGADRFPQVRVGQTDHRDVLHPRVGGDEVFHVAGGDVLAPADDDVLEAPGDADDAPLVDHGQVAGAEVAVGGEGLLVGRRVVEVAREDARAPGGELTLHPGGGLGSGGVEGHQVVVRAHGSADGVADDLLGVVRPRLRTRAFDHPERVGVAHAQPALDGPHQVRRAVRRPHVHLLERGEIVVGQAVEGGDAAHQGGHQAGGGHTLVLHHPAEILGPGGVQHHHARPVEHGGGDAHQQRQVVAHGGAHQDPVGDIEVPRLRLVLDVADVVVMRARCALGQTGGAARRQDLAHGRRLRTRGLQHDADFLRADPALLQCRERQATRRHRVTDHDHLVHRGDVLPHLIDQGGVVRRAIPPGHDPAGGLRESGQVGHLAGGVVHGQQHHHQARLLQGEVGYDELRPVGELQQHPVAGNETGPQQAEGHLVDAPA